MGGRARRSLQWITTFPIVDTTTTTTTKSKSKTPRGNFSGLPLAANVDLREPWWCSGRTKEHCGRMPPAVRVS